MSEREGCGPTLPSARLMDLPGSAAPDDGLQGGPGQATSWLPRPTPPHPTPSPTCITVTTWCLSAPPLCPALPVFLPGSCTAQPGCAVQLAVPLLG